MPEGFLEGILVMVIVFFFPNTRGVRNWGLTFKIEMFAKLSVHKNLVFRPRKEGGRGGFEIFF